MAIDTGELYTQKMGEHSATSSSTDFLRDFLYALTRTLLDIGHRVGVSPTTMPSDIDDDPDIGDYYFGVLCDGIDFYLRKTGRWANKEADEVKRDYTQSLRDAHGYYLMNNDHESRIGEVD